MIEPDYFAHKRVQLGMDRADDLERAQQLLDSWYPGQAKAKRWHRGVLRVVTPSSSVASELRMRQIELMEAAGLAEGRLAISIGT
jgi:hypothetical protein